MRWVSRKSRRSWATASRAAPYLPVSFQRHCAGLRAVRLGLEQPELLMTQLRAMVRASVRKRSSPQEKRSWRSADTGCTQPSSPRTASSSGRYSFTATDSSRLVSLAR
ncbi:MAG: hypothetical protein HC933_13580 [Pleurocapsa sp. SU_196_0]|nr:hypothetical protein [Pleurocapsa sp. SU_196_0]